MSLKDYERGIIISAFTVCDLDNFLNLIFLVRNLISRDKNTYLAKYVLNHIRKRQSIVIGAE